MSDQYCVVFERNRGHWVILCNAHGVMERFDSIEAAESAALQTLIGKRIGFRVHNLRKPVSVNEE